MTMEEERKILIGDLLETGVFERDFLESLSLLKLIKLMQDLLDIYGGNRN